MYIYTHCILYMLIIIVPFLFIVIIINDIFINSVNGRVIIIGTFVVVVLNYFDIISISIFTNIFIIRQ